MPFFEGVLSGARGLDLDTPAAPLRAVLDPDCFPDPTYFESLDLFDSWADARPAQYLNDACERRRLPMELQRGAVDKPRLMVCHDFQGGYQENPEARGYTFEWW